MESPVVMRTEQRTGKRKRDVPLLITVVLSVTQYDSSRAKSLVKAIGADRYTLWITNTFATDESTQALFTPIGDSRPCRPMEEEPLQALMIQTFDHPAKCNGPANRGRGSRRRASRSRTRSAPENNTANMWVSLFESRGGRSIIHEV